jgi:hypothetical protein
VSGEQHESTNAELLAEARRWPHPDERNPTAASVPPSDIVRRLADAIEVLTVDRDGLAVQLHDARVAYMEGLDEGDETTSYSEPEATLDALWAVLARTPAGRAARVRALPDQDGPPHTFEQVVAEHQRAIAKGFDAAHDDEHGREHLIRWAIDYAMRGETLKSAGMLAALNLYDSRHPVRALPDRAAVRAAVEAGAAEPAMFWSQAYDHITDAVLALLRGEGQ